MAALQSQLQEAKRAALNQGPDGDNTVQFVTLQADMEHLKADAAAATLRAEEATREATEAQAWVAVQQQRAKHAKTTGANTANSDLCSSINEGLKRNRDDQPPASKCEFHFNAN